MKKVEAILWSVFAIYMFVTFYDMNATIYIRETQMSPTWVNLNGIIYLVGGIATTKIIIEVNEYVKKFRK